MARTLRFPLLTGVGGVGVTESSEVITLFAGSTLHIGGEPSYVSVHPWWIDENSTETPFGCIALEFDGLIPGTIGSGTDPICIFGEIDLKTNPATTKRELLGMLGINFAGTRVPQIPLVQQAAGNQVGYTQLVNTVAVYDALSIGTLFGNLVLPEGQNLIVRGRPLRTRDWMG